jgi:hypothetical protein
MFVYDVISCGFIIMRIYAAIIRKIFLFLISPNEIVDGLQA